MDFYGLLWTFMNIYGHLWTFMDIYGHLWTFMDIYGHLWTLRTFMGLFGLFALDSTHCGMAWLDFSPTLLATMHFWLPWKLEYGHFPFFLGYVLPAASAISQKRLLLRPMQCIFFFFCCHEKPF
jgi:hypothetical protein